MPSRRPKRTRRVGHGRDDGDGRHVHQEEAAAVEEGAALGAEDAQEREPDRPEDAGRGHRSGLHRRDAGLQLPRVPEERQAAAEHQAADAGVRPVVDERRVDRVVQQRHQHGRGEREGQHGDEQPVRPLAEQHQEAGQGQRPQQVELLLHGQRPQVAQQRRPLELVEVGRAAQDEVPVHRVGEGGEEVTLEAGQLLPDEQDADQGDGEQQCEHRGQEPAGPAEPEVLQADGAVAPVLAEQQHRDQVAADHEEHLDAEEAAPQPRGVAVVDDHRDHGQGAQAVQPREVRDRLRVRRGARSGGREGHVESERRARSILRAGAARMAAQRRRRDQPAATGRPRLA